MKLDKFIRCLDQEAKKLQRKHTDYVCYGIPKIDKTECFVMRKLGSSTYGYIITSISVLSTHDKVKVILNATYSTKKEVGINLKYLRDELSFIEEDYQATKDIYVYVSIRRSSSNNYRTVYFLPPNSVCIEYDYILRGIVIMPASVAYSINQIERK